MSTAALQPTFARFAHLAEAFIAQPSVVAGLELDEAASHLKRLAGERDDAALTDLLHRFLRAIPSQDVARLRALLPEIANRVASQP